MTQSKAAEFQSIDLVSVRASVAAAAGGNIKHFIYVSVAQPAPVMKAYQEQMVNALIASVEAKSSGVRVLGAGSIIELELARC